MLRSCRTGRIHRRNFPDRCATSFRRLQPGFYPISHRATQTFGKPVIDGQDKQESYETY
ncbi:hypothetical protein L579_0063 [Pantoea sp. AS-PWVM4]|nr:hypothetical protein L579_0063 [Pantoea sp. AS-PWVM4]